MTMMNGKMDRMENLPAFQQGALDLLEQVLETADRPVEIVAFGCARIVAVDYNRYPELMLEKVRKVHLCAGTATSDYRMGSDAGCNAIPGGEWNVALDPDAFVRVLESELPVALYPCAGIDGATVKDTNTTFGSLSDLDFVQDMNPRLQQYLDYVFLQKQLPDWLRSMDDGSEDRIAPDRYLHPFPVWETPVWLEVTGRKKCLLQMAHTVCSK